MCLDPTMNARPGSDAHGNLLLLYLNTGSTADSISIQGFFATAEHIQYAYPCDRVHAALTMRLCCLHTSPQHRTI